eukprot:scaffold1837_cov120-Skeletonema_dohrnii-CCMP3373.AAC.2
MNITAIEDKAAEEQQGAQAELRGGEKHWMNRVLDCDVCFPHLDDTLPSASASASASTTASKPVSTVVTEGQEQDQDMTPADKYSTFGVSQSNGSSNTNFSTGDVSQTDKYASVGGAYQGNGKSRNDMSRSIASVAPPESYIVYSKSPVTLTSTIMQKEEAKYGDSSTQSTSAWKHLFSKGKATLPKTTAVQQAIENRQDTNTDGRRVSWRSMATNKALNLNADHGRDTPPAYEPETSIPRGVKPLRTGYGSPMLCGYGSCGGGGPMSPQHGQHYYYPQHPSSSPYGSNPSSPYGPYSPHHQQHYQQNYPPQQQQQQYQPQQQYPPQPQQHYQQNYPPY